jgi:predicted transcriptional regulator
MIVDNRAIVGILYYMSSNGDPVKIALTDREADIMQVLWDKGASIVDEVRSNLGDHLAYTTVQTILRTLETKGYVGHREEGRVHRYFAAVEQQDARKSALQHLSAKLFKGSSELLFAHLVSDRKLKPEELRRMRQLLDRKAKPEKT